MCKHNVGHSERRRRAGRWRATERRGRARQALALLGGYGGPCGQAPQQLREVVTAAVVRLAAVLLVQLLLALLARVS